MNSRQDYIHYTFFEVVQEWITVEGKRTIMAKPMNMGSSGWIYSEPLSIKGEYGSYSWNYRGESGESGNGSPMYPPQNLYETF